MRTSLGVAYDLGRHIVWCPKYRRPVLGGRVKIRLEGLIRAKAGEYAWQIVALEVMFDHVRLFIKTHPKNSPSYVANQIKGFTSRHLRAEFGHLRSRLPALRSRSCFVATVGAVSAETVQRYIEMQYQRASKGGGRA
ncbi:IS200/IS605 family transposase [Actinoallomurus sp. NBC_01490]|uniref:IS200/IS605 family transposase n=1 Tax=Actinoallomurus sp. NBC_01490 TaxID=2903557 RepID=UPI003FA49E5F